VHDPGFRNMLSNSSGGGASQAGGQKEDHKNRAVWTLQNTWVFQVGISDLHGYFSPAKPVDEPVNRNRVVAVVQGYLLDSVEFNFCQSE